MSLSHGSSSRRRACRRGLQTGDGQPGQRIVIEAKERLLAPQHRQHILPGPAGTGVVAGEAGVAKNVTDLVLTVDPRGGLVGGLPVTARQPSAVDRQRLVVPLPSVVGQPARNRAAANGDPGILEEGQQRGLGDIGRMPQAEGESG